MNEDAEAQWQKLLGELGHAAPGLDFKPLYEFFVEFVSAGFTEDQALRLIAYGMFHQPNNESE